MASNKIGTLTETPPDVRDVYTISVVQEPLGGYRIAIRGMVLGVAVSTISTPQTDPENLAAETNSAMIAVGLLPPP